MKMQIVEKNINNTSIWLSVGPITSKCPSLSPYVYCANKPIKIVDLDGIELVKSKAGTIAGFHKYFNNTSTLMGTLKGNDAHSAMLRLGKTEWKTKNMRFMSATTGPFNNSTDKYIYPENGGWIDMYHFFYAGKAYEHKQNGEKYL